MYIIFLHSFRLIANLDFTFYVVFMVAYFLMHLSVQLLISFPVKVIAIVLKGQGNIVDHLRTVTMSNALIKAGDCKNGNNESETVQAI